MFKPALSLRRYGASPGSHAHAHFQVLWGWKGTLSLEIEGRGASMTAGRVVVIPPGARHDFQAEVAPARVADCFVLDTLDPVLEPLSGQVLDTPPALPHLLEFLQAQPADGPVLAHAAPLLLASLSDVAVPALAQRPRRDIDWWALQHWVDAHLAQPIGVAELAAEVHLGASQFAARCLARWGMPPLAWVRTRRLAQARRLRAEGLPVAEVAARCGYRSPSALTAAQRRHG